MGSVMGGRAGAQRENEKRSDSGCVGHPGSWHRHTGVSVSHYASTDVSDKRFQVLLQEPET